MTDICVYVQQQWLNLANGKKKNLKRKKEKAKPVTVCAYNVASRWEHLTWQIKMPPLASSPSTSTPFATIHLNPLACDSSICLNASFYSQLSNFPFIWYKTPSRWLVMSCGHSNSWEARGHPMRSKCRDQLSTMRGGPEVGQQSHPLKRIHLTLPPPSERCKWYIPAGSEKTPFPVNLCCWLGSR